MYVTSQKKCQVKFGKFCTHSKNYEISKDVIAQSPRDVKDSWFK